MSVIAGTHTEVQVDTWSDCLIVLMDEEETRFVPADEVVSYLKSPEGLALRTRRRIASLLVVVKERIVAIRVYFKCTLEPFFELDIRDALRALFTEKGYQCA